MGNFRVRNIGESIYNNFLEIDCGKWLSLPTTTPLIKILEDERNTICQIDNIFSLYSHLVYCTVVPVISYNFYKLITVSVVYSVNIKNDMLDSYKIALDCVCMQFQCPFSH